MKKLFLFVIAIALVACNGNKVPELTGISLNKKSIEIEVGDTYKLKVRYEPEEAAETAPQVIWESANTKIAKVDDSGKVTAKAIGKTTITATCGKLEAECEVVVKEAEPEVEKKLILSEHQLEVTLSKDLVIELTVSLDPEDAEADGNLLVWSSSDEEICTVDGGQVSILNYGEAVIKVEYEDYEPDSCVINILPPVVAYGGFSVSSTQQVAFSQGNLQYQASTDTWRFALEQNISLQGANTNISDTYDGWIDLFGWGTGDRPTFAEENGKNYPEFVDWGTNKIWNGGDLEWRTLTQGEWAYLLVQRTNADKLRGNAVVGNKKGIILLPDDADIPASAFVPGDDGNNEYILEEWKIFETYGAIFLPCTGSRFWMSGSIGLFDASSGEYWSSTPLSDNNAWFVKLDAKQTPAMYNTGKHKGLAVRLVSDVVAR